MNMRIQFRINVIAGILAAICTLPVLSVAQPNLLELLPKGNKEWQRLSNEGDSTTDVGVRTLILEPNGIFRANFRIQSGKAEKAPEKPDAKYKTRIMTIQFDYKNVTYRIFETTLLDSSEKVVYSSGPLTDAPWKPNRAGDFYAAASRLSPLGKWIVTSSTERGTSERVTGVTTELDRFEVGRTACSAPDYESVSMTRDDLAKINGLGTVNAIDMSTEKVNAVKIKCSSQKVATEIHILILKSLDRAILLSGGEMYVLERLG